MAAKLDCRSVAFTYNDPVIFAEYAIDVAQACHDRDVFTVAVTAGYITPQARAEFFQHIDGANVDLKAFSSSFYKKTCSGDLSVVQETLRYLVHESDTWLEITTLLIPGENDSDDELRRAADWVYHGLGPDVPWHFTAFHPDYKMPQHSRTPAATLLRARKIALEAGQRHVYVGNIHDSKNSSTYCSGCGACLIERDWFQLGQYELKGNDCRFCGQTLAGRFGPKPEAWGRKRQPVRLSDFD